MKTADYYPDNWIIISIPNTSLYKVVAGWSGGYLDGDSWKVNSGIESVTQDDTHYYIKGFSGSVYACNKRTEELRMNLSPAWVRAKELGSKRVNIKDLPKDLFK